MDNNLVKIEGSENVVEPEALTEIDRKLKLVEFKQNINLLVDRAKEFQIITLEDNETAKEMAKSIKAMEDRVGKFFNPGCDKLYDKWQIKIEERKEYITPVKNIKKLIKTKRENFAKEQEIIRQKKQEELQKLANEKAIKDQEQLLHDAHEADKNGDTEKVETLMQQAAAVEPIEAVVLPEVVAPAGTVTTKLWTYEITDPDLIPRKYLIPDTVLLERTAKVHKDTLEVPGIRFYQKISISDRKVKE